MSNAPTTPRTPEGEIFLDALEQPTPDQRAAFLERACAGDSELRAAVDSLLAHHLDDHFLESPRTPMGPSTAFMEGPPGVAGFRTMLGHEQPGDRIGRYKLLQIIGEGGGGTVFMAEQEEPVRRRVALKIIKPGMDTRSVIARFESERQALAMMDHPNIAKVFDGGVVGARGADDAQISNLRPEIPLGRPYFVMELVRGVRLTQYCDEQRVRTRERLRLFITVCQAIQHAHQKGVVHRDIKPSNILVTLHDGVPVPKVIDFGIAKAIDQRLTDKTVFTEFHAFIGTPAYMSPEQAEMSGLDIDTRTDVYSLGVLLYEMLTGRTPFDAGTLLASGLDGIRRTLREEEPVAPSTRVRTLVDAEQTTTASRQQVEPGRLVHLLRGDLDWVVLKALEKDRNRRYETASALAADVQRILDHEPVVARPPSAWYRFVKLVRRNRLAFAVAGAFGAALVFGLTLATWQYIEKSRAYQRLLLAEQEQRLLTHKAERAQATESTLRRDAQTQERRARQRAYAADMNLAAAALAMNNLGRAQEILDRHRPGADDADFRGWEWRYLWLQTQSDALFTLCRRPGEVQTLSASPDGRWVAVGDRGAGLSVWDLRTREVVAEMPGTGGRSLFAFSPVAPLLAFASVSGPGSTDEAQRVRLWNAAERRFVGDLPLDGGGRGLAFSTDGTQLVTADASGTWTRWSVPDGRPLERHRLPSLPWFGPAVLFSRDLRLAACADQGGRVRMLDVAAGRELWSAQAAEEDLKALAFSPDGTRLATGAGFVESTIRIWDVATGSEIGRLEGHRTWVSSLVFWPDGKTLASASGDQTIRLWDLGPLTAPSVPGSPGGPHPPSRAETGHSREVTILRGHRLEVWSLCLMPDRTTLISGSKDGSVCVWDTTSLRRDRSLVTLPDPVRAWAFAPDNVSILAIDERGRLNRWRGAGFQDGRPELDLGRSVLAATFSPDTRFAAVVPESGRLQWWDLASRSVIREWETEGRGLHPIGFLSPSNHLITFRWEDGEIQEWVPALEAPRRTLRSGGEQGPRSMMVISPDEKWWLTATPAGGAILRATATGQESAIDLLPTSRGQVAFSPDGRLLAAVGGLGTGSLWETASARRLGTISGFLQGLHSVAFSPDGRRLAIGSNGREAVKLWDTDPPQELLTLAGEGSTFHDTAFSPDGSVLGSRNSRGVLHLWRAPSLAEIARDEAASHPEQGTASN